MTVYQSVSHCISHSFSVTVSKCDSVSVSVSLYQSLIQCNSQSVCWSVEILSELVHFCLSGLLFVDFRLLARQNSVTSIIVCETNVILFAKTFMTMMILKLFYKLNTLMRIIVVLLTNYDTCHNSRF